jgi:Uma2 family endonuclease
MSESPKPHHPLTVEEYLELEESAKFKHEYVGGEIHAMVGASYRHNRIAGNVFRRLSDAANGGSCRVYISDMKVALDGGDFYYPDVMVVCEPLEGENPVFETKPCLVVEVISPSTETTDRREKLSAYQRVTSLGAYLIAAQDRRWLTHYIRDENGAWRRGDLTNEGRLPLPCPPETTLSLDEIYAGL